MAQQTAVQELFKWIEDRYGDLNLIMPSKEIMLEKERHQIEQAVMYGLDEDGHTGDWKINVARTYYDKTYKNK